MRGKDSDEVGTASPMSNINMEKVKNTVRPRPIFCLESLGRQKVSSVSELSMIHGTITLNA